MNWVGKDGSSGITQTSTMELAITGIMVLISSIVGLLILYSKNVASSYINDSFYGDLANYSTANHF